MKNMLSLEAFADWAEKQPAEKEYDYTNPHDCAFCQYLKSLGIDRVSVDPYSWHSGYVTRPLPAGVDAAVRASVEFGKGGDLWTFGSLATRLRKASAL